MAKLPKCDKCIYYAHDYHIVCAIHPTGLEGGNCPDFSLAPKREEGFEDFLELLTPVKREEKSDEDLWYPEGASRVNGELVMNRDRSFYNGEEIMQQGQRWTREEMLELLDEHPLFTGKCPQCKAVIEIDYSVKRVHFDCARCGWLDDSV